MMKYFVLFLPFVTTVPVQAQNGYNERQIVLTLDSCIQRAVVANKTIQISTIKKKIAENTLQLAQAMYKPVIQGGGAGFLAGNPVTAIFPQYGAITSLDLKQPVYTGGMLHITREQAYVGIELSELQRDEAIAGLILEVKKTYWQIVSLKKKKQIDLTFKSYYEELSKKIKDCYDNGSCYKNDLLKARVQLSENNIALAQSDDMLHQLMNKLSILIGTNEPFEIQDSLPVESAGKLMDSPTDVNSSPQVLIQDQLLKLSILEEKKIKAERAPSIGLNFSAFSLSAFDNKGIGILPRRSFLSYYGFIGVKVPLLSNIRLRLLQQRYKTAEQSLLKSLQVEQVESCCKAAKDQVSNAIRQITFAQELILQAGENLRLVKDRFDERSATLVDLLEAQSLKQKAEYTLIMQEINLKIAEAVYQKDCFFF